MKKLSYVVTLAAVLIFAGSQIANSQEQPCPLNKPCPCEKTAKPCPTSKKEKLTPCPCQKNVKPCPTKVKVKPCPCEKTAKPCPTTKKD